MAISVSQAVLASIGAAIFFGLEGVVGKRGIESGGSPLIVSFTVATISIIVFWGITLQTTDLTILISQSVVGIGVFLFAGILSSGLGVLAVYQGVDKVGASVNTAVLNSRPLFVAFLGFLILSETLALPTVGGIVVLAIGLVVIALSKGGDAQGWNPRDLLVPLGGATAFALGNIARRYGLTQTNFPLFQAIAINATGGFVVLGAYVFLFYRKEILTTPVRSYLWFSATGLCTAGGLLTMFYALERERVAIVDSIIASAPLFSLLFTAILLRDFERITHRVIIGAVLVVVGGILIVN